MAEQDVRTWRVGDRLLETGRFPLLMGIVNVTPDSFSDGGEFLDAGRAVEQALSLAEEGADILDIGGESTRPGAEAVTLDEELRRVLPVIEALRERTTALISIDTSKAEVARRAVAAGADLVNDVTGLEGDPAMPAVCAATNAGIVCMHARGTPQTMQNDPRYEDCVGEIGTYLAARVTKLEAAGIAAERICLDPGIGFGKTAQHNLEILSNVAAFRATGRPVLIGHSRKRFLSKVLGRPVEERTAGTLGVAVAVAAQHADVIRVHDVGATRDALVAWREVMRRVGGV